MEGYEEMQASNKKVKEWQSQGKVFLSIVK